ncbi:pentaheme c-type cytochrome TorC [Corticimicrobacter populi]|uniref:Cytochrome c-type protein n=1 Tax=Corticimicrobacter populi TaxID=2175229 RepID=A0A2V1JXW5_9BURK|nr:pentaheme c-type cytochrome TorC [Corticimicrobacter populi]PWF21249.1 pentaheme c-type cytochrome TorC [Corticimicrobacter populi]
MKKLLNFLHQLFLRPSTRIGLGILVTGGFLAGILSWQGFNTALKATNEEAFCISCHTMHDNSLQELKNTVHWSNRSGVRAYCADCHVPHDFTDKIARKIQASREVLSQILGDIDTREQFLDHRIVLAQREWARFEANGSKECRSCHDYDDMDFEKMKPAAREIMRGAAERDQSCVSCHRGIAHELPDVKGGHNPAFDPLRSAASSQSVQSGQTYYLAAPQELYAEETLERKIGHIEMATAVKVLETKGDAQRVELLLWRKNKGYGRVWYSQFGLNITNAILEKEVSRDAQTINVLDSREDALTGLEWQQVQVAGWIPKNNLIDSQEPIWSIARSTYNTSCSVCHRQPQEAHFDANTWPGMFNGMVGFTNLDNETAKVILKYLQNHSSDFSNATH